MFLSYSSIGGRVINILPLRQGINTVKEIDCHFVFVLQDHSGNQINCLSHNNVARNLYSVIQFDKVYCFQNIQFRANGILESPMIELLEHSVITEGDATVYASYPPRPILQYTFVTIKDLFAFANSPVCIGKLISNFIL